MSKMYKKCVVCGGHNEHEIAGSSVLAKCDACMGIKSVSKWEGEQLFPSTIRKNIFEREQLRWRLKMELNNILKSCKHEYIHHGKTVYGKWEDEPVVIFDGYSYCQGCGKQMGRFCSKNPRNYCQPYPDYVYGHYKCGCGHDYEHAPEDWTCIHCGKFYEWE